MHLSFQKIFYVLVTVFAFFAILVIAKAVLIPIAFALIIAFILFPVCQRFRAWGINKIVSAFLSMLCMFIVIGGGIYLFSNSLMNLSDIYIEFQDKIISIFTDLTFYINKNLGNTASLERGELFDKLKEWFNNSIGDLLGQTFSGTSAFLVGLVSTIVFTFLILIYRNEFADVLILFYPEEKRPQAFKMFKSVQKVGQKYLYGMMLIVIILGFVNSIGLWIIGVENPFLFGFLAAVLAIVPYVGTLVGAAIPILYALMTYDSIWMPITIAIYFWAVQFIESNFLTPKVVGGNLKVNALTSILSIIIGASVWGIAGMILFLPFAAMFRVFCENYEQLKPLAMLIGDQSDEKSSRKNEKYKKVIDKIKEKIS